MPDGIWIRPYTAADVPEMAGIWNEVVRDGVAFPQTEELVSEEAAEFFAAQSECAVAEDVQSGEVLGICLLYTSITRFR